MENVGPFERDMTIALEYKLTHSLQESYICFAGWSSPVARWAHNPKVVGSNPTPATNQISGLERIAKSDSLPLTPNKKIDTFKHSPLEA
jgi:hypothetical protein